MLLDDAAGFEQVDKALLRDESAGGDDERLGRDPRTVTGTKRLEVDPVVDQVELAELLLRSEASEILEVRVAARHDRAGLTDTL